jgi:HEAT repeat protein
MKSKINHLEKRGYITDEILNIYLCRSNEELTGLLKNENAVKRTAAAKILGKRKTNNLLPLLCDALKIEKKLYTKIAICEAIENFGITALEFLIPLIGKIGSNQHRKVNPVDLRKKSFPLPRDIITRIIIRIGSPALPHLEDIIINGTYGQKTEAIDAIGHIAYNYNDCHSEKALIDLYENSNDELIKWKIIRAFQSYRSIDVILILKEIINHCDDNNFKVEAKRSLMQIQKRINS